jgi:hypothetical protein
MVENFLPQVGTFLMLKNISNSSSGMRRGCGVREMVGVI